MNRREFVSRIAGLSALSLASLEAINARAYETIAELNQRYPLDASPDGVYWNAVRDQFLFADDQIMMNNGTVGPMPRPVAHCLAKHFKLQCTNPFEVYTFFPYLRQEVHAWVADFIGAELDEVVINRTTTEGMNLVANGLDLEEGDEVLISDMEHPGGRFPWQLKAQRSGIEVVEVPLGLPPADADEVVQAFRSAITDRTRVISVSHTVYISGLITPIKRLAELAHEHDLLLVADSAHGIGMIDLDVHDLGVDLLASSPYKWLGAPVGCGVLYVRREVQDRIWPTIAGSGWDDADGADRFETLGQRADPVIFALGEAVKFQTAIFKHRIANRILSLANHLKQGLAEIPGVRLQTPLDPELSAGLTAFSIAGLDPELIVSHVQEKHNIVIRPIGKEERGTYGVRVSTPCYIRHSEVDLLLEAIDGLARRHSSTAARRHTETASAVGRA
jgi:selenocysteine lyase/cysteine desulfurase